VERIIPHGEYNAAKSNQHDIALIQLRSPVELSDTIATVCLWSGSENETYVAGQNGLVNI
jgi:hypothetical protein